VLIADEIQSGAGRTGTWFAIEPSGVVPDLITMAKSMAGGFPISAVIGRADIMDAPNPGGLGGTYAGNPLAAVAALEVLKVFEKEQLLARSRTLGVRLKAGLQRIAAKHRAVGDVRGLGAMMAMELFKGGDVHAPDAELTQRVVTEAARRGLILLSCGSYANIIRVMVPLTASDAIVDEGLNILEETFAAVA
jgi:4-aminobutyrate aminotransferase/(S)-3-amino-2-methylpropionate transaminase